MFKQKIYIGPGFGGIKKLQLDDPCSLLEFQKPQENKDLNLGEIGEKIISIKISWTETFRDLSRSLIKYTGSKS